MRPRVDATCPLYSDDMRRLSGPDAAFWFAETHAWHMHGAGLTICDPSDAPGFCFRAVKDLVASRLPEMPELSYRVIRVERGAGRAGSAAFAIGPSGWPRVPAW